MTDRTTARATGSRFYIGAPCSIHPDAMRYTASKACTECAKLARRKNTDTERDKLRKRAARAAARSPSIICDALGI